MASVALESGAELARATLRRWIREGMFANLVGTAVVFSFLSFAAPSLLDSDETERLVRLSAVVLVAFLALILPVVVRMRRRHFAPITAWLREDRSATESERDLVLGMPLDAVRTTAPFWVLGAVVFGAVGATESLAVALYVGGTVLLGGVSTCAVWYLLVERLMRPVTARALAAGAPGRPPAPGVTTRLTMAWTLATAVPVLGAGATAVGYLADVGLEAERAFAATLVLLALALVLGLFAIRVAARSVADPVAGMRGALARVHDGDYEARVAIDDASEVGLLQAGFNEMAAGLRERERIREAFGTYVDKDVAEHILREGTSLAGEEVEVTMMFMDIRGFTTFAEKLSASEVVATLNRLFERIVPIIHAHHGHVDKYVGDGLLAVFGAPRRQDDHAHEALASALEMAAAVQAEFGDELSVGIGLNSGPVVAGNVGGAGRLEFSVIGDAVNVAARVESATRQTGDVVLIAERTKELLAKTEIRFVERPGLTLKGKTQPVAIYAPLPGLVQAPNAAAEAGT